MPPLVPTVKVKVETLVIVLIVGILVFLFALKSSNVQIGKTRDCEPTKNWSTWSTCTRDCQGGYQYRTRSVAVTPLNYGKNCSEDQLLQSRSCNDYVECGQNCRPGNPANYEWYPCPPCNQSNVQPLQWKIVPPVETATFGGQDCSIDEVFLIRECENFIPPCAPDIDCVLSPYYTTPCSAPCGSGTQYIYSSITQFPSGNGKSCDYSLLVTQQDCYLGPCNCDSLSWSNTFSECNAACGPGIKVMFRDPQPNNPADGLCPYISVTNCTLTNCPNLTCTAPSIDFVQALCYLICAGFSQSSIDIDPDICLSDDILNAVCGFNNLASLQEKLANSLSSLDNFYDFDTQDALVQSWFGFQNCAEPKDCSLTSFSAFGNCSLHACQRDFPYGGTRTRVRTIVDPGNSGGLPCTDQIFVDYEPCNHYATVTYSAWSQSLGNFVESVSSPQCTASSCTLSSWYSVTSFMGGCGSTCSQTWNRSITNAGSNPGSCPTQTDAFVSTTKCCGVNPDAVQTNCGTLPTCVPCKWLTWTSLSLRCNYDIYDKRTVTIDAPLVQETNQPGQSCFQLGSMCSWDSITLNNPTWSQFSCSKYFKVCDSPNICPVGCDNYVCSNHGITSITSYTGGVSCTCVCDYGFSGTSCQISLTQCPIASISGLECNGLGSCSGSPNYTCSCNNVNDTTTDCTGSSTSWCWVYGVVDGNLQATTNSSIFSTVRKLLGAIPIASTSNYIFTENYCQSISQFANVPTNSITLVQPQPILFGMNFAGGNTSTVPSTRVNRMYMYGNIHSEPPATLITELGSTDLCRDFNYANNRTTKQYLSQTFGTNFASNFIPRYLPSSSPIQCENIFTFSTYQGANQNTSVLSLSNVTATGPLPAPYAATGLLECTSSVGYLRYKSPSGITGSLAPSIGLTQPSNGTIITLSNVSTTLNFTATSSIGISNTVYTGAWFSPSNNVLAFTFSSPTDCTNFAVNNEYVPSKMTYNINSI